MAFARDVTSRVDVRDVKYFKKIQNSIQNSKSKCLLSPFLTLPPESKAKRKAEQASKLGVDARKKQRLSLESVESIPVVVETATTSSGRVEDVASHLSEAPDMSASPSVPSGGSQSLQGQVEETTDAEDTLESIAPETEGSVETEGRVATERTVDTGVVTEGAVETGVEMFGSLITAAATLLWQTMLLMSPK